MRARSFLPLALVLLLCTPARAEPPQVFWASDPVKPGETVLMVGSDLDTPAKITVRRLDDTGGAADAAAAGSKPGPAAAGVDVAGVDVEPLLTTAQSLMVPIPADMAPGVYRLRLATAQVTVEQLVNAPAVYWSQGDLGADAAPGGTVRVFGRDIARTPAATLTLAPEAGGAPLVLPAAQGGLWDARFDLPATLAPGRYALTLWNGHGDRTARADAGTMLVRVPAAPPSRLVTLSPARAGTNRDDTVQIQGALDELGRAGGGTLKLTRGRFTITAGLVIPQFVTVEGEERDMTALVLNDTPNPPRVLISGMSDFTLKNFSIITGNHTHIISGGFDAGGLANGRGNVTIDHMLIRASMYMYPRNQSSEVSKARFDSAIKLTVVGPDAIRLAGSNNNVLRSDVLSSARPLFLLNAKNSRVAGNRLYTGRLGWYSISRSENIIFEDNAVIGGDLQGSGGGANTLFRQGPPITRNIIFKGNSFERMFGGDREAMTTDGFNGCFVGRVSFRAGDSQLTVHPSPPVAETGNAAAPPSPPFDPLSLQKCVGGVVMVLDGAGVGQVGVIASADGSTLTLERPMQTGADEKTTAIVGGANINLLYIQNKSEDVGDVQLYGASFNNVIAENSSIRSGGFQVQALKYGTIQPVFNIQFLDNVVHPAPYDSGVSLIARPPAEATAPIMRSIVVRGNRLLGYAPIKLVDKSTKPPGMRDVLVEGNRIEKAEAGIFISNGPVNVLLRNNSFKDNLKDVVNLSAPEAPVRP